MPNQTDDFFKRMGNLLKERENPTDLKSAIIGKVVKLNPIIVQIEDGLALLEENEELEISEWFKFRCNIDKNGALSSDVPDNLTNAKAITEIHSKSGTACTMQNAISYLATAIEKITGEILALKCELKEGDYVEIASLTETNKYILIDKIR